MARKVKREFVDLEMSSDEIMADVPGILSKTLLANLSDDADYNASQSTGT